MTKQNNALRLADWLDDQYDPDHYKADAAAELRRLHAGNAALQQGYDAARLEIESLRDEVKEYRHGAGVQKALIETLLADKPAGEYPPLPEPKFARVVDGIPCITLLEHGLLMRTALASAAPAPQLAPAPSAVADLIAALEEARSAINSMKVEAETAGQGDEQMMLEACETISNEGLQADMAIRAALASAPKPYSTPQADSQPAPVLGTIAHVGTGKTTLTGAITSALRAASTEADNVTAPAGATSNTHWNQAPCAHCGCTEGQHFITRCHHIQGETRYTPTPQADSQPAKVELFNPLEGGNLETELQMAAVIALRDSQPALPEITAEDLSFLHYNPNTDDIVEWVHNYASAAVNADRAARAPADSVLEDATHPIAVLVSELRKHRFCGDCYPESGWPGVNDALARYELWKRAARKQGASHD